MGHSWISLKVEHSKENPTVAFFVYLFSSGAPAEKAPIPAQLTRPGVVRVRTPSAPYVAWLSSAVSANVCRVSDRPRRGRAFWRAIRRKDAAPNGSYGAASPDGWVGQLALVDRAPSRGRVLLASCFVPTMHRATPGTRTLPSFSNALTFAMAFARIRSRAGSSTC
jgi:hypothetical protein